MTVIDMLKQDHGLDNDQANSLQAELKKLEAFFDKNFEDSPEFFQKFYSKFEQMIAPYGFEEGDAKQAEPLVSHLYLQGDFKILVSYIIPAFYQSGEDSEIFSDTYTQLMNSY
ncbi:hypothetical protein ACTXGJ_10725 [Psychrobacter sp. 1Y11]|uniref:hypothetical protein n=1 Tax=Psychrobacter sp. 1Y11 TaxID=3457446 RepID=UPI003FD5E85A